MTTDAATHMMFLADTNTNHQPVIRGAAVLRKETAIGGVGMFDGAWWPRSREIETQLPSLLRALGARLGRIASVGLNAKAWDDLPGHLVIDHRTVDIDWSADEVDTMTLTRGQERLSFLMVPSQAAASAAHTAMTMAVEDNHCMSAEEIFLAAGIDPARVPPSPSVKPAAPYAAVLANADFGALETRGRPASSCRDSYRSAHGGR